MKKYFKKIIYTVKTEEIKHAYEYWKSAMMKGDLVSLDKMYAENFSWTNELGITSNKKQSLYKIASGNLQYVSWMNKGLTVKIIGGTAVLKTREILKLIVFNHRVNLIQDVTAVFVNENGKWLLAGGQEMNRKV